MRFVLLAALLTCVSVSFVSGQSAKDKTPASELEWARDIAESFLQVTLQAQSDELIPLITERLWRSGKYPWQSLYSFYPQEAKDKFTRWTIEKATLSPERDEARINGSITGLDRKLDFKLLVTKTKEGKWRVDAFSAADTPESSEKKQTQHAELQWARQTAAGFVAGWAKGEPDDARVFLGAEIKKIIQSSTHLSNENDWLRDRKGFGYFGGMSPRWEEERLAPGGEEAYFMGTFTRLPQCCRFEFQVRMSKEKNWRVLSFQTRALPTPLFKGKLAKGLANVDTLNGWLGREHLRVLGVEGDGGIGYLDKAKFDALWPEWELQDSSPRPAIDFAKVLPVFKASNSGVHFYHFESAKLKEGAAEFTYDVHQQPHPANCFHLSVVLLPREGLRTLQDGNMNVVVPEK